MASLQLQASTALANCHISCMIHKHSKLQDTGFQYTLQYNAKGREEQGKAGQGRAGQAMQGIIQYNRLESSAVQCTVQCMRRAISKYNDST